MRNKLIEEILIFLDNLMRQDRQTRHRILNILQKHFDRFRAELEETLAGPSEGDTAPGAEGPRVPWMPGNRRVPPDGRERNRPAFTMEFRDVRDEFLLRELFGRPYSERDLDDDF